MRNMDQTLLNDIELDVQELKYLVTALSQDKNQALCEVAKRSVLQMRSRLDVLYQELSSLKDEDGRIEMPAPIIEKPCEIFVEEDEPTCGSQTSVVEETSVTVEVVQTVSQVPVSDILRTDLRHSISLNDSFRFTRELFRGDSERMNRVIKELDSMRSLDEAMAYAEQEIGLNEDNDAAMDFVELLKKRFN